MLSQHYSEIKRLRSSGDCTAAISLLRTRPPSSDEDAFEAAVCLFVCGDIENAVHVCQTHAWKKEWALRITGALADTLRGGNDSRALSLARTAIKDAAAPYDASALYLLLLQKNGLIEEASAYITSRFQHPPSGESLLLTIMAEIAVSTKDWRQAYRLACGVLSADPDDYRALMALSFANYGYGNIHESLGNARRAILLNEGSLPAILQIMRCQNRLGDYYAAIVAFDKLHDKGIIAPDIHVELGTSYSGLEDRARAISAYRTALAADTQELRAIRALVAIHATAGETAELDALLKAYPTEINRDRECIYWIGLERLSRGDLDHAARLFGSSLTLYDSSGEAPDDVPWPVPEPRIRHDYEQLDLLQRRGRLDSAGLDALQVLKPYYAKTGNIQTTFAPAGAEGQALKRALSGSYNLPDVPFAERALGENDYGAIEEKYLGERLVVIDNFLSPGALSGLRRFCEEATVWKNYNKHGYVGALLALGFSPRVLLAVSDELRRALPRIIGDQPLLQAWGYKYDQRMQGINMHADFAKVNVNFWITPQDACEDPASGGMVVYDLPVPKSWTFADYNTDPERLAAFLKVHNAKPLRVPYRENRCVLFDSSLIHISDRMHFNPGYENRRVNVTLLYGKGLSVE
jgi:tetratricopeptide (TPR) repeat protein